MDTGLSKASPELVGSNHPLPFRVTLSPFILLPRPHHHQYSHWHSLSPYYVLFIYLFLIN